MSFWLLFHKSLLASALEKMKMLAEVSVLMLLWSFLSSGRSIDAISYDYSATKECLTDPREAQYGGGIIANPEFKHGIEGWNISGQGSIREGISKDGNRFAIAHSRKQSLDSVSQKVQLEKGKTYSFSAWIQVSEGSESVSVVFRTVRSQLFRGGQVIAKNGCWSMLKGGIFANFSNPMDILFESKIIRAEIWIDSVSLQPFTMNEWKSHQDQIVEMKRKSKVRFQVNDANGTAMKGTIVSIKQTKSDFPFGCGMNYHILESKDYQGWFASRFKYATFTNAMKWYSTEEIQGQENYTVADAMVQFCQDNGISIRGHNVFWDDPKYQPKWVPKLSPDKLRAAAAKRIDSVVSRYAGQLIAWDVVNENLHFSYFEDRLGRNASSEYYLRAYQLDPSTKMFMNEYNTIEYSEDEAVGPCNYRNKLEEILSYPGNEGMLAGIGLQGHFGPGQPNLAYMRSSMDILASTGLPIWLTEVSVAPGPDQAEYLEQVLREGYSHPAVEGIIMFAGPILAGFNETTLANEDFTNTAAGDVVDKLIQEWEFKATQVKTGNEGSFEILLFHGDYDITVQHPATNSSRTFRYKITGGTVQIHINI